jgi:FkbH-like protein
MLNPPAAPIRRPQTAVSPDLFSLHNGPFYRAPLELRVTPDPALRFLVVGACLAEAFPQIAASLDPGYRGDFVLLNNFDTFPELPAPAEAYDFQIIQLPMRSILGNAFFQLPDTLEAHEAFLRETEEHLSRYLANALRLNAEHRLPSFVLGFLVPQQNPQGRFQARYDLRNLVHFIERLNMALAAEIARRENVYFVDADQVSSGIGKRMVQDDMVWSYTHGTTLSDGDHDHDLGRLQPPVSMQHHYRASWIEFFAALLHEVFSMHRTIRQQDMVKLVAVDLDDTLWRGVASEGTLGVLEGWPLGFIEALLLLRRRGVLLAIISKNSEPFVRQHWNQLVQGQIPLSEFAAVRINFRNKAENLREILAEVNLRPENTVFVDDNPTERAQVQHGVPGVRVLGSSLYYLKRVLLWAPETQQRTLTRESRDRTKMIQAQSERDAVRQGRSQEEFLGTLGLKVAVAEVEGTRSVHMARALELLNKTNQFNTTGERHTLEGCARALQEGTRLLVIEAEDRFIQYGLIGAAWLRGNAIDQLVMSCRALGLGIEDAFLAALAAHLAQQGHATIEGTLKVTEANHAARPYFARNGFAAAGEGATLWSRPMAILPEIPAHVALTAAFSGTRVAPAPALA